MVKILVIGAKGMAGHVIKRYLFAIPSYKVYSLARNIEETDMDFSIDVSDTDRLHKVFKQYSFDVIINCIGILNKDAEDNPEKAIWFNSYFPHLIESWLKDSKTKFIHISTDCVFSGKKGSYTDNDFKDGFGFYAQSKALGEVINNKDLTIRTSIIGPELNTNGIGLFHWFMSQPLDADLKGYTRAFWSGITTIELAKVIHEMIEQQVTGLYQIARPEKIDKYSLLRLFNDVYREGVISILADNSYRVDKSLISTRQDFDYNLPTYKEMILQMKEWISKYKALYSINYSD